MRVETATNRPKEEFIMPNWVYNMLYVTGPASDAASLRSLVTTDKSKFDFTAVIPMPPEIEKSERSSAAKTAWELKYGVWSSQEHKYGPNHFGSREAALQAARLAYQWQQPMEPSVGNSSLLRPPRTFDELADAVQILVLKYGHADWYSWAQEHWGTKWSASNAGWMSPARAAKRESEQVAYFETAWSPPFPLIRALSERYPHLTLRLEYDEAEMGFRGFQTLEAGLITAEKMENYDFSTFLSHDLSEDDDLHNAVYIGAGRKADGAGPAFAPSIWANPFAKDGRSDAEAAELYRQWLEGDGRVALELPPGRQQPPDIIDLREQLRGKTLLCDCRGGEDCCHGGILLAFASGWPDDRENCSADETDSELKLRKPSDKWHFD